jgi:hypothetical protein
MLLEQGAKAERDTFQGERCLYNALNDRIRNLLLSYDYSKSTDPLQPLAGHITSLLTRDTPKTSDIAVQAGTATFQLHKFVLSARSPYFAKKLSAAPETTSWKLSNAVPPESFEACIRYLYLGEAFVATVDDEEQQEAILLGVDKLSRQLEIPHLFESILQSGDRKQARQARQRRTEEVERGRDQLASWFEENVLRHKLELETEKAGAVHWDRDNGIFADVLLRADDDQEDDTMATEPHQESRPSLSDTTGPLSGIPIGHFQPSRSPSRQRKPRQSTLFPAHRAMLLRSDVFSTMFSSSFREGQELEHLQIIPVDCSPEVLEVILIFLYTEKADFGLSIALDVLHAADMLFIEKLKLRAALLISTLGNGSASVVESKNSRGEIDTDDIINVYDVVRAGWDTRVHRLEEFGARYIAYRLERYINEPEFKELVKESASRIQSRQETDTVELVDDIRWYLSERFRLRFEDAGLEDMMDEDADPTTVASLGQKEGTPEDEGVDVHSGLTPPREEAGFAPDLEHLETQGIVRTLDGDIAGDEFAQDAMNYQILLGKIERLMENLGLDG